MKLPRGILLLLSLSLACQAGSNCVSHSHECKWEEWKARFGKLYNDSDEEQKRFRVFVGNLEAIKQLNNRTATAHFDVNQFSDLTREEFARTHLISENLLSLSSTEFIPAEPVHREKRVQLPANYISPYMTPVHDQGSCGSCWAFTAIAVAEAAWKKSTGISEAFSVQQMIDCDHVDNGCGGGFASYGLQYLRVLSMQYGGGIMRDKDYPYRRSRTECAYNASRAAGRLTKVFTLRWDEDIMDYKLFVNGPLAVALDATSLQSYSYGILEDTPQCRNRANHAVVLVGWGIDPKSEQPYWVLKNSWGNIWGEGGLFRIQRGKGACLLTEVPATGAEAPSRAEIDSCIPIRDCGTRVCGPVREYCPNVCCGLCPAGQDCNEFGFCTPSRVPSPALIASGVVAASVIATSVAATGIFAWRRHGNPIVSVFPTKP